MAKREGGARPDTGEVLSKPPPPQRGFPWRLWLFAIVMTAGAGAGGYFTWQYRQQAAQAVDDRADCAVNLGKLRSEMTTTQKTSETASKDLASCTATVAAQEQKAKAVETQLRDAAAKMNATMEELATLRTQRAETEKRLAAMEDVQKQFAKMIDAGQLEVKARNGNLVISLPSEVLFASGSADVSEKGQIAIIEIGVTLKKLSDRRFLVLGHTDDQPLNPNCGGARACPPGVLKDNWELSTARALNVTRTLVKAGMDAKNLIPAGSGEHDPLGKDRAKNRRIEIALLPALSELPPLPSSLGGAPVTP
ncbi:MAG: OmpA family protein [Kofleriaceae bacterium]